MTGTFFYKKFDESDSFRAFLYFIEEYKCILNLIHFSNV